MIDLRGTRALPLVLLLSASLAGRVGAEASLDPDAKTLEQARLLLEKLDGQPPVPVDEVVPQLVGLGQPVVPCLAVLIKGREVGKGEMAALAVLTELSRGGIDPTGVLVKSVANGDAEARATGLRLLARLGTAAALKPLVQLMSSMDPGQAPMLDMTIVAILSRNPMISTYRDVEGLLSSLAPNERPRMADCLGLAGSPLAGPLLAKLLGSDRRLDLAIATAVGRIPPHEDEATSNRLQQMLLDSDAASRCAAAVALGRTREVRAAERLVALLEDQDGEVRRAALSALREISGLDLTEGRPGWEDWLASERTWAEEQCPRMLEDLGSGDHVKVIAGAREASTHPFSRGEGVPVLVTLLGDPSIEVRLAVCGALERLGAPEAVPPLVDALDDEVEEVRTAAWTALRKITSMDLASDPDAWRGRWGLER